MEKATETADAFAAEPSMPGMVGISQYSRRGDLARVTVPEGVWRVDDYAFYGCESLRELTLPDGLTEIGEGAFAQCTGLTSVVLPAGVKEIGRGAFDGCKRLEVVELPETFTDIRPDIFSGCEALREVKTGDAYTMRDGFVIRADDGQVAMALPTATRGGELRLPKGVTGITPGALTLCAGTKRLFLPKSVVAIDKAALEGLGEVSGIDTEEGGLLRFEDGNLWSGETLVLHIGNEPKVRIRVTGARLAIGARAFAGSEELREVEVETDGECEVRIGDMAFEGCTRLGSAPLTEGTTHIGTDAFAGCAGIETVVIPAGVREIGDGAFADCTGLKSVDLHDEVEEIGSQTFIGCARLTAVEMPVGLRRIGMGAFAWSGLRSVAVPPHVEEIGAYAFGMCREMEAATMPSAFFGRTGEIFSGCPRLELVGTNNAAV